MATDPRWTEDEKKRRRSLQRERLSNAGTRDNPVLPILGEVAREQGLAGVGRSIYEGTVRDLGKIGSLAGEQASRVIYGSGGPNAADEETPQERAARNNARDLGVRNPQAEHADLIRQDPSKFGLTRIVKNPDGSYTNVTSAIQPGAETRYYNQYGNREGMDVTGRKVINDPNASDAALLEAAGNGRRSLAYAQRGSLERVANDQQRALDAMDPSDRAKLMLGEMAERGALQRTMIENEGRTALIGAKAQAGAAGDALEADKYERELLRTNPGAAISETLGGLGNLSREDKIRVLSNPEDPRSARVLGAIRNLTAAAGADPNVNLGQISKTGGLRRALSFGKDRFTDNSGMLIGNGFNPQDYGLTDDDFQLALDAYLQTQSRSNR